MADDAFRMNMPGLLRALELLEASGASPDINLPSTLPETGVGEEDVLERLAPVVLGRAEDLGAETAFAHMDPPAPWLTWAMAMWTASKNQNLLHPATSPVAVGIEQRVIDWLAPVFGMSGGHMTSGSTLANLTGLWAAREVKGARWVIASDQAHVSVRKAADILGLEFIAISTGPDGSLDPIALPLDMSDACMVLTAGTTSIGAIDPLNLDIQPAWTHVDAAWAGPLKLSETHTGLLSGIEKADSVSVSGHKWLFQPKDSGLIFFKDVERAHDSLSYGGAYLAAPNVGVQGSRGAYAVPLLATLMAFGRAGIAARIDAAIADIVSLAAAITETTHATVFAPPRTGVLAWRPDKIDAIDQVYAALPAGSTSRTQIGGEPWLRNVAANPNVDIKLLTKAVRNAIMENL